MPDAKMYHFPEGAEIIKEGEIHYDMFKIIKGHAEVYVGYGTENETLIGIIGEQQCFGEFSLLLHEPDIYTVIAYSDVYALHISEEDLGDFIMQNHKNIMDIMRNMARTMMTMRRHIELLVKELESGNKPDEATLFNARRAFRGYGMYRSIQEASDRIRHNNNQ